MTTPARTWSVGTVITRRSLLRGQLTFPVLLPVVQPARVPFVDQGTPSPRPDPEPRPARDLEMLRVRIPAVWKRELEEAARVQSIDVADLVRIILRGFLRDRYDEATQRALGLI